ncbi:hypothetical protein [Adhaeretor mobilis]|uniref:Uncharacterized protein n=1 Tax=Adhaeretor mobilis TaxID=1930276 RepID=A0A517N0E6_9BACT|nr:hypothetical protein [Adhaeretor mobilis]QDT00610.1 hypothetical protein HG15A2_39490 [Adhaeretor mobilis]
MQPNPANSDPNNPTPLDIAGAAKPSVPVFACLVYVHTNEDGIVTGRIANLASDDASAITASASSEREVLGKLTREFKSRVGQLLEASQEIPWIEPPPAPAENEQMRSIPLHL